MQRATQSSGYDFVIYSLKYEQNYFAMHEAVVVYKLRFGVKFAGQTTAVACRVQRCILMSQLYSIMFSLTHVFSLISFEEIKTEDVPLFITQTKMDANKIKSHDNPTGSEIITPKYFLCSKAKIEFPQLWLSRTLPPLHWTLVLSISLCSGVTSPI